MYRLLNRHGAQSATSETPSGRIKLCVFRFRTFRFRTSFGFALGWLAGNIFSNFSQMYFFALCGRERNEEKEKKLMTAANGEFDLMRRKQLMTVIERSPAEVMCFVLSSVTFHASWQIKTMQRHYTPTIVSIISIRTVEKFPSESETMSA